MLQKNDFVELEYIGKVKDGNIFDTNIKEEAKKIQLEIETRPLIICLGQNFILQAIDEFLIGKEIGKYTLELSPEKAFGLRNTKLIKTMPIKIFLEKQVYPQPGMMFEFDNVIGRISAVSGGRVIVDFNHPLSNKTVVYELNIKKLITDEKEKVEALQIFFFRRKFDFDISKSGDFDDAQKSKEGKKISHIKDKKLIIKSEAKLKPFFDLFKDKFKEILNLELEIEGISEKSEEKTEKAEEKEILSEKIGEKSEKE